jgi:hypothetical protein
VGFRWKQRALLVAASGACGVDFAGDGSGGLVEARQTLDDQQYAQVTHDRFA